MKVFLLSLIIFYIFAKKEDKNLNFGEDVENLTDLNFHQYIKENECVAVFFYAPWCPHCKSLESEYGNAGSELGDGEGKLSALNCVKFDETCIQENIPGFPTIKLYRGGEEIEEFESDRTKDSILKWMKRKCGPSTIKINNEEDFEKVIKLDEEGNSVFLGFFNNKEDSDVYKNYILCSKLLEDLYFVEFDSEIDQSFREKYGVKDDEAIILLRTRDDDKEQVEIVTKDFKEMKKDMEQKGYPRVVPINISSFKRFKKSGKPILILYLKLDHDKENKIKLLEHIADNYLDKVLFGYTNMVDFGSHLESLGGNKEKEWGIVIMNIKKSRNYIFQEEYEKKPISKWISGVLSGEILPYMKSQQIPENQFGDIQTIVGKNYNEVMFDESKDVIVLFYAPWCGHCKSFLPTYKRVAKFFSDVDELLFTKMDGTENDCPDTNIELEGFPTTLLYKGGEKNNPIPYHGDRTERDFKKFLYLNSGVSKVPIQKMMERMEKEIEDLFIESEFDEMKEIIDEIEQPDDSKEEQINKEVKDKVCTDEKCNEENEL